MMHFGPYSVPAYNDQSFVSKMERFAGLNYVAWYWYFISDNIITRNIPFHSVKKHHIQTYGKDFNYDDFIPMWQTPHFDANKILDLFESAGIKYVAYPAKHHDGFCLWDTQTTGRNSVDLGPHRNFVDEIFTAAKGRDLKMGFYYSNVEFYNPANKPDLARVEKGQAYNGKESQILQANLIFNSGAKPINPYSKKEVPYTGQDASITDYASQIFQPQIRELMKLYNPEFFYLDIGGNEKYYKTNEFLAEYYNHAKIHNPEGVLVNDRGGDITTHRDYNTFEYGVGVRTPPFEHVLPLQRGVMTYSEFQENFLDATGVIKELLYLCSEGGNLMLGVSTKADGSIPENYPKILGNVGKWLKKYGDGVYDSKNFPGYKAKINDGNFYTLAKDGSLWVFYPEKTKKVIIKQKFDLSKAKKVEIMGNPAAHTYIGKKGGNYTVEVPYVQVPYGEVNYGALRITF
ncbi:MAG: hypothetical protein C4K58_07270 [Flavobacteriaceae bacterium]|nr:MAG: hypothetical protein C4K58_07270 [Flavobacteriaceae bacterium]